MGIKIIHGIPKEICREAIGKKRMARANYVKSGDHNAKDIF